MSLRKDHYDFLNIPIDGSSEANPPVRDYEAPEVGKPLGKPEGATVLKAQHVRRDRTFDEWIVLALWVYGFKAEFVVWAHRRDTRGVIDTSMGQYFLDLDNALKMFKKRIERKR